jgi:hypothetical protein
MYPSSGWVLPFLHHNLCNPTSLALMHGEPHVNLSLQGLPPSNLSFCACVSASRGQLSALPLQDAGVGISWADFSLSGLVW